MRRLGAGALPSAAALLNTDQNQYGLKQGVPPQRAGK
jgi:hypothetical protein